MRFPALGRRRAPEPPPAGPPLQVMRGTYCFQVDCGRLEGWQCSFVSDQGDACRSFWCPEHSVLVDGLPYCHRHAAAAAEHPAEATA